MITNFLSTKNNIISDYILNNNINAYFSKKEISNAEDIKRQQDKIVDICISSLIQTTYNNIKLSRNNTINIELPIRNVLWNLWNSSWQLGSKHGNNEIYSNFNSDHDSVNFIEEEKKQKNVSKSRILNIEKVKERKEEEQRINRENNITPLQESEFGKIYLEKRLQSLSSNLKNFYKEQLKKDNTLDKYFKSKSADKENVLLRKLESIIKEDNIQKTKVDGSSTVFNKIDTINKKLKDALGYDNRQIYLGKQIAQIYDNDSFNKQEKEILIDQLEKRRFDPDVELSTKLKTELGLDPNKTYKASELRQERNRLKNEAKKVNNVSSKSLRIALTELGHAYNLGRLDEYQRQGIELVKLNNSVEHLRRNVVCTVCLERAVRNNGYGKGIYLLSDVLTRRELQLVFHPYCACYYTAISETEEEKIKRNSLSIKINNFFDNNIAKWAAGGTAVTAILGTAVMYSAFRKTRIIKKPKTKKNIIRNNDVITQPNKINEPIENTSIITNKSKQQITKEAEKEINNFIINNKDTISSALQSKSNVIIVPLIVKSKIKVIELNNSEKEQFEKELQKPSVYSRQTIQNNISKVNANSSYEINQAIKNNPEINPDLKAKIDDIVSRLNLYSEYNKNNLTRAERISIINQYNKDLKELNKIINNIETTNIILYSKVQSLYKAKEEALYTIKRSGISYENDNYLNSIPSIRAINNTIEDVESTLRSNVNLMNNGFTYNLKELNYNLQSNPDLLENILIINKNKINKAFDRLPNSLGDIPNEINSIKKEITNTKNITDVRYRQLMVDLELINFQLLNSTKQFNYNLEDIDLDFISSATVYFESDLLGKAQGLKAYKELLIETQKQLFITTNQLINLKK